MSLTDRPPCEDLVAQAYLARDMRRLAHGVDEHACGLLAGRLVVVVHGRARGRDHERELRVARARHLHVVRYAPTVFAQAAHGAEGNGVARADDGVHVGMRLVQPLTAEIARLHREVCDELCAGGHL